MMAINLGSSHLHKNAERARRVERFTARQQQQEKLFKSRRLKRVLFLSLLGLAIFLRYCYFFSSSSPSGVSSLWSLLSSSSSSSDKKSQQLRNNDRNKNNKNKNNKNNKNKHHRLPMVSVSPAEAQRMQKLQAKFHQEARQEQEEFCRQWEARKMATNPEQLPPLVPSALEEVPSFFHEDGSFWLEVYPEHDIVSNAILTGGSWETEKTLRIADWLQEYQTLQQEEQEEQEQEQQPPSMLSLENVTFVDIGANVGWYTFVMADLGASVIAIEPLPSNVELMRRSLCRNPRLADRITIHAMALSSSSSLSDNDPDSTGKSTRQTSCIMYSGHENVGDGILHCSSNANNNHNDNNDTSSSSSSSSSSMFDPVQFASRASQIPSHRLDDVIGSTLPLHQHIGALKMDTEGHEGYIVEGGPILFGSGRIPHIQSEYVPLWIQNQGSSPQKLLETWLKAGYQIRRDIQDERGKNPESWTTSLKEALKWEGEMDILLEQK